MKQSADAVTGRPAIRKPLRSRGTPKMGSSVKASTSPNALEILAMADALAGILSFEQGKKRGMA